MSFGPGKRHGRRLARTSLLLFILLSVLIVVALATPVTVTKANDASYAGSLIRPYFENQNAPVTGCTLPCLTVDTQITQPTASSSFALASGSSMYLWSPQFVGTTTIPAGAWDVDFWAAAATYTSVAITLTNTKTPATPVPFQAMVQMNPASTTYSPYEASDLGNVGFCTSASCTTQLYSWLEGCGSSAPYGPCSRSSSVATFWVKLTSVIGASGGTLTIYMVFLPTSTGFDRAYRGEAPQLSATYGQFDNGANVFDLYFNGTTVLTKFNIGANNAVAQTTTSNPITGGTTLHVIRVTGYGGNNRVNMILTTPLPSGNPANGEVAESYSEIMTGYAANVQGLGGFCDSTTAGSGSMNAESEDVGLGGSLYAYIYDTGGAPTIVNGGGTDAALTWYYAALAYPGTGSTSFSGIVSTTFYASYATSTNQHPITGSAQLYWCSLGSYSNAYPDGLYFNWGRARAYPPGGVLPTVVFGTLSSNTVSVSIYTTASSGSITPPYATVATNVQSPPLGTAESEYAVTIGGAQVTVPANGYILVLVVASSSPCTFYWGAGQPSNFQTSFTSRTS